MAVISGKDAKIVIGASNVQDCTGWTWNRVCVLHAYNSCATGGTKKRVAGPKDSTGSLKGLFDVADDPENYFTIGDSVTLKLYLNSSAYYSVPAVIETLDVETDVDDGPIIPWTSNFGGNGAWSSSGL